MTDFTWFFEHLKGLSRQSAKTLVKAIGLTPHQKGREWSFRDQHGQTVDLPDVFDSLMNNAKCRSMLESAFSYPRRTEEEWQQRKAEQRRASLALIAECCRFLTDDFGYSEPFEIPATIEGAWILGFRNERARRQIEVSGRDFDRYHGEVRRLIDGTPGAYRVHSFGDWEIREFRERRQVNRRFVPEGVASLTQVVQTLKRHPDVLNGEAWLDRDELDAAFEAGMRRRGLLPKPGSPPPPPTIEDQAKHILISELGFAITYDSSALTPHESQMWEEFVFRREDVTIDLQHTDIRVPDEWWLKVNGAVVAQGIDDIAAELARLRDQPHSRNPQGNA